MAGWLDGWMDGWLAGWMDGSMAGWLAGWMDGSMAGWLAGWMDGWLDGWMDGCDGWSREHLEDLKAQIDPSVKGRLYFCKLCGSPSIVMIEGNGNSSTRNACVERACTNMLGFSEVAYCNGAALLDSGDEHLRSRLGS